MHTIKFADDQEHKNWHMLEIQCCAKNLYTEIEFPWNNHDNLKMRSIFERMWSPGLSVGGIVQMCTKLSMLDSIGRRQERTSRDWFTVITSGRDRD